MPNLLQLLLPLLTAASVLYAQNGQSSDTKTLRPLVFLHNADEAGLALRVSPDLTPVGLTRLHDLLLRWKNYHRIDGAPPDIQFNACCLLAFEFHSLLVKDAERIARQLERAERGLAKAEAKGRDLIARARKLGPNAVRKAELQASKWRDANAPRVKKLRGQLQDRNNLPLVNLRSLRGGNQFGFAPQLLQAVFFDPNSKKSRATAQKACEALSNAWVQERTTLSEERLLRVRELASLLEAQDLRRIEDIQAAFLAWILDAADPFLNSVARAQNPLQLPARSLAELVRFDIVNDAPTFVLDPRLCISREQEQLPQGYELRELHADGHYELLTRHLAPSDPERVRVQAQAVLLKRIGLRLDLIRRIRSRVAAPRGGIRANTPEAFEEEVRAVLAPYYSVSIADLLRDPVPAAYQRLHGNGYALLSALFELTPNGSLSRKFMRLHEQGDIALASKNRTLFEAKSQLTSKDRNEAMRKAREILSWILEPCPPVPQ